MEKRRLRVLKWLGTIPVVAVCTLCHRQFNVPITAIKKITDAQENLTSQFAEHTCKEE
jgi:hypothetical protein